MLHLSFFTGQERGEVPPMVMVSGWRVHQLAPRLYREPWKAYIEPAEHHKARDTTLLPRKATSPPPSNMELVWWSRTLEPLCYALW